MDRNEAKQILAEAGQASCRIHEVDGGYTLHLVLGDTQEQADRLVREAGEKALKDGRAVTWSDGTREWINVDLVPGATPGEMVWHEDGNRIKVRRVRVTVAPDGTRTETPGRTSWRSYDAYFAD